MKQIDLFIRISALLVFASLWGDLPDWPLILASLITALDLVNRQFLKRPISLWITAAITIFGFLFVVREYRNPFNLEPSSILLTFLFSLKALEARSYKDQMLLVFLLFYLVMIKVLFSQSIGATGFMFAASAWILVLMFRVNAPPIELKGSVLTLTKNVLKLSGIALPFLICLFFVFPRFVNPMARQFLQPTQQSGFSNKLRPGDVTKLVLSNEVAMRVEFDAPEKMLLPDQLYWKGSTLIESLGLEWNSGHEALRVPTQRNTIYGTNLPAELLKDQHSYTATIEPKYEQHLFALDRALTVKTSGLNPTPVRSLESFYQLSLPAISRFQYAGVSLTKSELSKTHTPQLIDSLKNVYLQVPNQSEAITTLVNGWKTKSKNQEEILKQAESFYRKSGFAYTLEPPRLVKADTLTEFLFESKQGFCEHFAGSFATLMRVAGIPARVVLGFQGGEWNSAGGYLLIREKEAHAWTEVYLNDRGWVRVDPTGFVAPLRIQLGGEYLQQLSPNLFEQDLGSQILQAAQTNQPEIARLATLWIQNWEALTFRWHSFLIQYDLEYQKNWLEKIGLQDIGLVALLIVGFVLTWLTIKLTPYLRKALFIKEDPLDKLFTQVYKLASKIGFEREISEGHWAFANRLREQLATDKANKATEISKCLELLVQLKYSEDLKNPNDAMSLVQKLLKDIKKSDLRI